MIHKRECYELSVVTLLVQRANTQTGVLVIHYSNGNHGAFSDQADAYLDLTTIFFLWPALAIQAKRWHDRDKSAWWILINFIPLIGPFWALVENGFLKGSSASNSYGEPYSEDSYDEI